MTTIDTLKEMLAEERQYTFIGPDADGPAYADTWKRIAALTEAISALEIAGHTVPYPDSVSYIDSEEITAGCVRQTMEEGK